MRRALALALALAALVLATGCVPTYQAASDPEALDDARHALARILGACSSSARAWC